MTGGLLQLASQGNEDVYLTDMPSITLFKAVYRRHTNFSREEIDNIFTNRLDFGKEGFCKLEHYGDLVHRLYLVAKLPSIDLFFKELNVGEVKSLLLTYGIVWETPKQDSADFTSDDLNVVSELINLKLEGLTIETSRVNEILARLRSTGEFFPSTWKANNPNINDDPNSSPDGISPAAKAYLNQFLIDVFVYDQYELIFRIIDAQIKDVAPKQLPLANSIAIQNSLHRTFLDFAISEDQNPTTFNDRNLELYYNVDSANYAVVGSINQLDSTTVISSAINAIYGEGNVPTYLDAYKIFNSTLETNVTQITNQSDIQNLVQIILNNIAFGLVKNIRLLKNIYNSLINDAKFIFYRRFPVLSNPNQFDKNSPFVNESLVGTTNPNLQDNFTSDFLPLVPATETVPFTPIVGTSLPQTEPANVVHFFSNTTRNEVQNFHTANRDQFRQPKFIPYFDDLNLWVDTEVRNEDNPRYSSTIIVPTPTPYTPASQNPTAPRRMNFMNYIWFIMNEDIPQAINTYLDNNVNQLFPISLDSSNRLTGPTGRLQSTRAANDNAIRPLIIQADNYTTITALNDDIKTTDGSSGDKLIFAIIKLGNLNTIINGVTIPEFIINNYHRAIDDFLNDPFPSQADKDAYDRARPTLKNIVNLFMANFDSIPSYSTWLAQGRNLTSDPNLKINTLPPNNIVFNDAISSIWNYLFIQFVSNFNGLYNNIELGYDYFLNNVGAQMLEYLKTISSQFLNYTITDQSFFDYFRNQSNYNAIIPAIGGFLDNEVNTYYNQLQLFNTNRKLLDMIDILLVRRTFLYEEFDKIVNELINRIEDRPNTYNHTGHDTPQDIAITVRNDYLSNDKEYLVPRNNAMDIVLKMRNVVFNFLDTASNVLATNPYNRITEPNKFALFNDFFLRFSAAEEKSKFNRLFDRLYRDEGEGIGDGARYLFQFLNQINTMYGGFVAENDVNRFMLDIVVQNSLFKDIPGLLGRTVSVTHANLLNYYVGISTTNTELIGRINGTEPGTIPLLELLGRGVNFGERARFAWVRKIGHYLIEKMWIKIDDQLVDEQYGEWLEIWHELSKRIKKERGYKLLIGDVPELTTLTNKVIGEFELYIPLQYWFCKHVSLALPLVALHNAEIKLYFKIRELNELSFFDDFSVFKKKPMLDCRLLTEYIFVDDDEKTSLVKSKLEYLTDVLQFNGELVITKENLNEEKLIDVKTMFKGPCKEFFWFMQRISYIDGSLPFGERKWHVYSYDLEETVNPIQQAKIKFNARDREVFKDIEYYNLTQPYERHYSDSAKGVNVYSFSLDPESIQPSGSANMSKIEDASIEIKLRDAVIADMIANDVKFRLGVYATSYNWLRIFSGLSGLVYYQ